MEVSATTYGSSCWRCRRGEPDACASVGQRFSLSPAMVSQLWHWKRGRSPFLCAVACSDCTMTQWTSSSSSRRLLSR